jgi:hypothetical protein
MADDPAPKVTKELEAKCDAPNQFGRFDALFRAVISIPKAAIDKEETRWKRRRKKRANHHA